MSVVALVAAADIGDPDATRTVYAIVALLVVLGIALVMLAAWLWRVTRPDPDLLAPLELMGERGWRRGDPVWQRRRLEDIRPDAASPLTRPVAPPDLDESFDAGPSASGFSDLSDAAVPGEPGIAGLVDAAAESPGEGPSPTGAASHAEPDGTPMATDRPLLDDLGESEIDPEILAQAAAELDGELRDGPPGDSPA